MPRYETMFDQTTNSTICFIDGVQVPYEQFLESQRQESRERMRVATVANRMTLHEYPINTAVVVADPEGLSDTWFGIVVGYGMSEANKIFLKIDEIGRPRKTPVELAVEYVEKV